VNQDDEKIMAIKRLKARYFRLMDTKDWDGWRALFTDDAVMEIDHAVSVNGADPQTAPLMTGGDELVRSVRSLIERCSTVHHGHMPEIDILSETTARGIWAMEDIVSWPNGDLLRGYGHYHEEYRLEGDSWRIARLHLTRIRLDFSSSGVESSSQAGA